MAQESLQAGRQDQPVSDETLKSDVDRNDSGRLKGHYWVRCGDEWTIGLWSDEHQYIAGWTWTLIGFEEPFDPNELDEVDERRIVREHGDSVGFRLSTEITWHATCWKHGPLTEDGCGTVCLLPHLHDGEHVWTRDDHIRG